MKKNYIILIVLIVIGLSPELAAQVGFNNPNPDPSAVIDIKSTDKGLLIPRMTTGERNAMAIGTPTPAHGLLVFDTGLNRIYYWNGSAWKAVNVVVADSTGANEVLRVGSRMSVGAGYKLSQPPTNGLLLEGKLGVGTSTVGTEQLTVIGTSKFSGNTQIVGDANVSGKISATNYALTTGSGNGPVPSGVIVMWSGSVSTIPSGWALCNGSNNTPNLTDRFIVGAGSNYSVSDVGGAKEITLTQAQTPLKDHNHAINIRTSTDGAHSHKIRYDDDKGGDSYVAQESADAAGCCTGHYYTDAAGAHSHLVSGTSNNKGDTTAAPHENRPPFYALAYIMKL